MTGPITPEGALALIRRWREVYRAAELWARLRRDPAATRAQVLEAERRLARIVEGP